MSTKKLKAIAATGNLSTGFREESICRAARGGADFIGCDAGSTDSGPYYLGSGKARGAREVTKHNTSLILREALEAEVPAIIGTARYAGKVLECGAASVAQRMYPDCLMVEMDNEGFTAEPPNPEMHCSPQSVAAHTLYESGDPYLLVESGGTLDMSGAQYQAVNDRAGRVTGSRWVPSELYTVRIPRAPAVRYRSVAFAGARDPLVLRP